MLYFLAHTLPAQFAITAVDKNRGKEEPTQKEKEKSLWRGVEKIAELKCFVAALHSLGLWILTLQIHLKRSRLLAFWNKIQIHKTFKRTLILIGQLKACVKFRGKPFQPMNRINNNKWNRLLILFRFYWCWDVCKCWKMRRSASNSQTTTGTIFPSAGTHVG